MLQTCGRRSRLQVQIMQAASSLPRHAKRGPPASQGAASKRSRSAEAPDAKWCVCLSCQLYVHSALTWCSADTCLCRLADCMETTDLSSLLTRGLLGRLDLQTWQALASTSRACRRLLDGAQDVLEQLGQVSARLSCWKASKAVYRIASAVGLPAFESLLSVPAAQIAPMQAQQ